MRFEHPPQELVTPDSQEVEEAKVEENQPVNLERFEDETDVDYRRRMLDIAVAERSEGKLSNLGKDALARVNEVSEMLIAQQRERVAREGKQKIPQSVFEDMLDMARIDENGGEVEDRIIEFYEPVPEQVEANGVGNEKEVTG